MSSLVASKGSEMEPDSQETMNDSSREPPKRRKSMPTLPPTQQARSRSPSQRADASQEGGRARARSISPSQMRERNHSPTSRLGPTAQSKRGGRRPGKPKSIKRIGQSFRQMATGRRRPSGPQGQRVPPQGRQMGPGGESQHLQGGAENFTDEPSRGDRRSALGGDKRRNARASMGQSFRNTRSNVGQNFRKTGGYVGQSFRVVARPIGRGARKVTRPIANSRVGRGVSRGVKRIAPTEDCTNMKIAQYLVPIILIILCAVGLVITSGNGSRLSPALGNFNSANVEDPFAGVDVPFWESKGGKGLELTMVNALEDRWQVVFALAIADWDFGNPDALTLNTEQIDHDVICDSIDGKVKVCNGDYGDTKWRGINIAVVNSKTGYMEASSAKMNEFYLATGGTAMMQYTMCHEVGHSLGLPHS
jgi:hypothetical protein